MSLKYKLNYKQAPQDTRDYVLKPKVVNLPKSVDLSSSGNAVKDQGSVGSCTAFAGCAMNEYVCAKQGVVADFSEKFLYFATRVNIEQWPANEDSGAYVRDTLKAMAKVGICKESTFPYLRAGETESKYGDIPPPSAYTEAKEFVSTNYVSISEVGSGEKTLNSIKTLLSGGYPFMAGFTCYENVFDDVKGQIPAPSGSVIGGHAVLFVGYDDNKSLLKFKNSWGKSWGDNGYGYLPYSFVTSRNVFDIWTVYSVSHPDKPFDVLVPSERVKEFTSRMNDVIAKITEGIEVVALHKYINEHPRNNLIYPSDVNQLVSFGTQVSMTYTHNKNMISRNRLDV